MPSRTKSFHISIAGYTGWMGRWHYRLLEQAAKRLGVKAVFHLHSRNPQPPVKGANVYSDIKEFCSQMPDLLVLAVHPEHRPQFYEHFGSRLKNTQIFLEKPLSSANLSATENTRLMALEKKFAEHTLVYYPEVFDPLTELLLAILKGETRQIPRLFIRQIQVSRCKNREDFEKVSNGRHTEPVVLQEGVHDMTFILRVLSVLNLGQYPRLKLLSAIGSPLKHPSGKLLPLSGSSFCLYKISVSDTIISIINSFIDPFERKEKVFVCEDAKGVNYTVIINHRPASRAGIKVYDKNGQIIFDAAKDSKKIMQKSSHDIKIRGMTGPAWNRKFYENILSKAAKKKFLTNFNLAEQAEKYCREALELQSA